MTKKELESFIDNLLSKAVKKCDESMSLEDSVFELYKTVAEHYNNHVPQSIHNVFTSKVPTFEKYFKEKEQSIPIEAKKKRNEVDKAKSRVKRLEKRLAEIQEKEICVGRPKMTSWMFDKELEYYSNRDSKREAIKSLLAFMVTDISKQDPDQLNNALLALYKMQIDTIDRRRYIDPEIHKMFLSAYPQFEHRLSSFNQEDMKKQLSEELEEAIKKLASVKAEYQSLLASNISVYDDSPKKRTKSTTSSAYYYDNDHNPCGGYHYGGGHTC